MNIVVQGRMGKSGASTTACSGAVAVSAGRMVGREEGDEQEDVEGGGVTSTMGEVPGASLTHQHHPHAIITHPVQVACSLEELVYRQFCMSAAPICGLAAVNTHLVVP